MFETCPLLALIEINKNSFVVKRICEDNDSQVTIAKTFSDAGEELRNNKDTAVKDMADKEKKKKKISQEASI